MIMSYALNVEAALRTYESEASDGSEVTVARCSNCIATFRLGCPYRRRGRSGSADSWRKWAHKRDQQQADDQHRMPIGRFSVRKVQRQDPEHAGYPGRRPQHPDQHIYQLT
jgi:hypothetical protein